MQPAGSPRLTNNKRSCLMPLDPTALLVNGFPGASLDALALSLDALALMSARPAAPARSRGRVATLPLTGVLSARAGRVGFFPAAGMDAFRASLRQAADDKDVAAIVLDIDSPGGTVDGTAETAAAVAAAAAKKPVIAVANALACSAACWIAAQANEFVMAPHAVTGSIGVIAMHTDMSAFYREKMGVNVTLIRSGARKAEGDPYNPLSDQARLGLEAMVQSATADFLSAIAVGRRMSIKAATERFADGRAMLAEEALSTGLADRVATLEAVVAGLAQGKGKAFARRSSLAFV